MTCAAYVDCPDNADFPLIGYDSEAVDSTTYVAQGFGPVTPPPLNWTFGLSAGFAIATSTFSESAAKSTATANAIAMAQATWSNGQPPPFQPGSDLVDMVFDEYDKPFGFDAVPALV